MRNSKYTTSDHNLGFIWNFVLRTLYLLKLCTLNLVLST